MSDTTGIEWTDSTWSPLRVRVREDAAAIARAKGYTSLVEIAGKMAGRAGPHCEHVSAGCEHCYAETNNHRCLPGNGTGLPYDRRSRDLVESFVDEKLLLQPLSKRPGVMEIRTDAAGYEIETQRPRRIFVENQSDIFGEWVTDEQLDRVFAVMALCPQHTFQVLTKRAKRMHEYLTAEGRFEAIMRAVGYIVAELMADNSRFGVREVHDLLERVDGIARNQHGSVVVEIKNPRFPLPNVWLGVSVEDQAAADERIPLLLQTPAAVRFISAEPLLGPVNLREIPQLNDLVRDSLTGAFSEPGGDWEIVYEGKLDWVIVGGESGAGARPMHPDWARGLRDQCTAAGVPFFFKQWGEWTPGENVDRVNGYADIAVWFDGQWSFGRENLANCDGHHEDQPDLYRVGKKAAGALLDGREWREFPAVRG